MQAKGFIKFVAALCFLASIWVLSFTFVTRYIENKAEKEATDANGIIDETKLSELLRAKRSEKVWMGFTYKECKDKELSLGLDLKGGMNVMLEVSLPDIVKALARDPHDSTFVKAIALAHLNEKTSTKDFITLFGEAWEQLNPDGRMSSVFNTYDLRDRIKPETSNSEVLKIIREESEAAVANSFNVLSSRIDRFGVTSPNIQRIGTSGRIMVELPGVKEPERVRKLLQGTANLEFWETFENSELIQQLVQANAIIKALEDTKKPTGSTTEVIASDTTKLAAIDSLANAKDTSLLAQLEAQDTLNMGAANMPLFRVLQPNVTQDGQPLHGPVIGYALAVDTGKVNKWLQLPQVRSLFPRDFRPLWTIKAIDPNETTYALIAIRANTRDGQAPLNGGVVTDARRTTEQRGGFGVSMNMNAEGAKTWARMTRDNVNRSIAIVLDNYVYSYPTVNGEISGGTSSITGNFSSNDAEDLANVLKSGKMPAPAKIVQEAVVGPSLGQESINAGLLSFVLAFFLILIYMWFYYGQAGTTANIALLSNVLILFGAMASFGAVLTLPGIAGIVLTLGMAVDANVIIYERIKEELKAGNSQRVAIKEGYRNAMSAIIDGQLTTLIVGIILFFLGTGPVRGFATTLVVGIATSLATSIFISRLVFEWMLDKEKVISFGNRFTMDFMATTNVDFLGMRKKAYIFSIAISLIGLAFIFTKGMSYGVDFSGGRTYVVKFDKPIETNDVRESIGKNFDASAEVKQFGPSNQLKITTKYKIDENTEEVDREVAEMLYGAVKGFFVTPLTFPEFASTDINPFGIISSETVGPTIANDLKMKAVIAVMLALVAIFVYIAVRFSRWQFGFGGVIALFHDALFTVSVFSVGAGLLPWSMDVDQSFIAAILTIIGYSINDTVVIFDRIRENRLLFPKRGWREQINDAVNSTIMRTVNTSLTVLIVLLAIFIFGGEVIRGFSFALIVGVLIGVYSTVFIAIPVAYELLKCKEKKQAEKPLQATVAVKK